MSRRQAATSGPLGGVPRVDLLPAEIRDAAKGSRQRAWMTIGVIGALAAVVGVSVLTSLLADEAERDLAREQDITTRLLADQATYSEVRTIASTVDMIASAQQAAGLTDVEWTTFIATVEATLPGNVRIVEFDITSATPLRSIADSSDPLIAARVATIVFTAESADLPNVRLWLEALTSVPGFTDATPGTVQLNDSTERYDTTITMGVDEQAWSGRFAPEDPDAEVTATEEDDE